MKLIQATAVVTLGALALLCWPITVIVCVMVWARNKNDNKNTGEAP